MSESSEKNAGTFFRPRTFWGALPCAFVCLLLAYVAHLYVSPRPEPMRRLWVPYVVETNGNQTALGETRQLEFWTPSTKTKDYLAKKNGEYEDKEKWQVLASDEALLEFGMALHTNQNVFGYRRIEAWGHGRTVFKPGWWWTMTVSANYSASNLAGLYQKFWKSPQPVMVEVIDNRGSSDK